MRQYQIMNQELFFVTLLLVKLLFCGYTTLPTFKPNGVCSLTAEIIPAKKLEGPVLSFQLMQNPKIGTTTVEKERG